MEQPDLPHCLFSSYSQALPDGGNLSENRRSYSCMKRRCIFFVLVVASVLCFYITSMTQKGPKWGPQNDTAVTETSVQNQKHTLVSTEMSRTSAGSANVSYYVEYPHKYNFIINEPQLCAEERPFVVLVVPVAPRNRAHRDIIRSTWGSESKVLGKVVRRFFLLGRQTGEAAQQLQGQLLQESEEHRDVIQSDFLDSYNNLTIKTMVMLEWLDTFCSGVSYAMKVDSDIFLNLANLIRMLVRAPRTSYLSGLVVGSAPVLRDPSSKWYLPHEVYPPPTYPRYALGLAYVLSLDLSKKLLQASKHVQALYIEDVYLGMCMEYLGLSPTDPPDWYYFHNSPVEYSRCAYSQLVATTVSEHMDWLWIWKDFKQPATDC